MTSDTAVAPMLLGTDGSPAGLDRPMVVMGWGGAEHHSALRGALTTTGLSLVSWTWPAARVVTFAVESGAAAVALAGPLSTVGLRAVADAVQRRPALGVVVAGPGEPALDVLIALSSGVSGYVTEPTEPGVVADAVRAVLAGEIVLPRMVSVPLVRQLRAHSRGITVNRSDGIAVELSGREWQVLVLLRQARTTAEIAQLLVISRATVRTHVAALIHKLGVPDRGALTITIGGTETCETIT